MFKKEDLNSECMCNVKENASRHLYTYSVSINVVLSEYLNVSPINKIVQNSEISQ